MDKNQKIAVAIIVAIALIAAWQLGKKPAVDQNQNENQNTQTQIETENSNQTGIKEPGSPDPQKSQLPQNAVWEGVLLESDNINKGNYRLRTKDHILYLRTSRDFNSMIGKEVKVTYEGTLESFVLGDIDVIQK